MPDQFGWARNFGNKPAPTRLAVSKMRRDKINLILREVAELPDRTSPEDQPNMMLVSIDELRAILEDHL